LCPTAHFELVKMDPEASGKKVGPGRGHLTPVEVQAIADAIAGGASAASLAGTYGVSRQTIYNASKAAREGQLAPGSCAGCLPEKRRRAKRVSPEARQAVVELKRTYPTWGVDYLRANLAEAGHPVPSRATIYKVLREAGLSPRPAGDESKAYQRFEMARPGQLWQMDIQGKVYFPNIGWVYGFAILDDYSRFCVAYRYFTEETLSNGVLLLAGAIAMHGVPEALYTDNGSQFRSRGTRMNNFELYCSACNITMVAQTPYRPQGKGKVERFYQTVEKQFLAWARSQAATDPNYSTANLNSDLAAYLEGRYNVRVHGGTKETPAGRFNSAPLRHPDPVVDAAKYLERSFTRRVNKFGEVPYKGYKVQVDLPVRATVTVVETLESLRLEHGGRLVREVDKQLLSKDVPVKRQDGVRRNESSPRAPSEAMPEDLETVSPAPRHHNSHKADLEGFYHRRVNAGGNVKVNNLTFYCGQDRAGTYLLLKIVGNQLHIFDEQKQLIDRINLRAGRRY